MMLKNVKMPIVAGGGTNSSSLKSALRRGFTIMELVIVIAVIAVLAAVLIPTFANLTERANESADTQTVKNLNTILSSEEVLGNKAENMTEAIEIASSGGYNVTALTPTSDGNDILWNQDTNRFVLADSETGELVYADEQVDNPEISVTGSNYTYWKIVDSDTDVEDGKYSYYLSDSFADNDITVTTGIDVGENTDINITYQTTASQSVIFNTNGGTLTIDAANSDVKHYGTAEATNITAVKGKSYELYGTVDSVSITQGRVYVAESGYAALVEVSENAATVIVDATSSENIGDIVNNASSGSVTVADEVKDNVLNSSVIEASKDFAGGYGTEANPFQISTEEQLAKVADYEGKYFVQIADIIITKNAVNMISLNGVYDGGDFNITVSDSVTLDVLSLFVASGSTEIRDINLVSSTETMLSAVTLDTEKAQNITVKDVDISSNGLISLNTSNAGFIINSHVYSNYDLSILIEDCNISASVSNTATCTGVFIGGSIYWALDTSTKQPTRNHTLTIRNCSYEGTIYGAEQAGLIFGNQSGSTFYVGKYWTVDEALDYITAHCTIENVVNNGNIYGGKGATIFGGSTQEIITALHEAYISKLQGNGSFAVMSNALEGLDLDIYYNADSQRFVVVGTNSETYTYRLGVSMSICIDDNEAMNGRQIYFDLETSNSETGTRLKVAGIYSASYESYLGLDGSDVINLGEYLLEDSININFYIKDGALYLTVDSDANSEYPYPVNSTVNLTVYAIGADGVQAGQAKVDAEKVEVELPTE